MKNLLSLLTLLSGSSIGAIQAHVNQDTMENKSVAPKHASRSNVVSCIRLQKFRHKLMPCSRTLELSYLVLCLVNYILSSCYDFLLSTFLGSLACSKMRKLVRRICNESLILHTGNLLTIRLRGASREELPLLLLPQIRTILAPLFHY